jgi:hypothetical protein
VGRAAGVARERARAEDLGRRDARERRLAAPAARCNSAQGGAAGAQQIGAGRKSYDSMMLGVIGLLGGTRKC